MFSNGRCRCSASWPDTLELNYVGNKGTHLLNRTNIGQPLPPSDPALCASSGGTVGDCPVATRRLYANITSANGFLDSEWDRYSNYNAFNAKPERRTRSMAFLAVYTWRLEKFIARPDVSRGRRSSSTKL